MRGSPIAVAEAGYSALAPLYDEFVAHPLYRRWVLAIERRAREIGVRGPTLLDIGCGTGRSLTPLIERGYVITGCEPVAAMREQARRRCPRRVRIVPGAAAELPGGRFDLVLALNDVVNSLTDVPHLRRAFAAVAAALRPGGVFAFDVSPRRTYEEVFLRPARRSTARAAFEWRPSSVAPLTDGGSVEVRLVTRTARAETTTVHRQRHHAPDTVEVALREGGLRVRSVSGCDPSGALHRGVADAFKHIYFTQRAHPER